MSIYPGNVENEIDSVPDVISLSPEGDLERTVELPQQGFQRIAPRLKIVFSENNTVGQLIEKLSDMLGVTRSLWNAFIKTESGREILDRDKQIKVVSRDQTIYFYPKVKIG